MPGLAKTLSLKTLAQAVGARFQRIQFTPDMLPSDIVGTLIYEPQRGRFETKLGPVFANLVLADEINRAPAKVQSALLEAMQERQVTLGEETHRLPSPFLVMATQNPIEHEGTYTLPEAQLDRFLLKVNVELSDARRGAGDPGRDGAQRPRRGRHASRVGGSDPGRAAGGRRSLRRRAHQALHRLAGGGDARIRHPRGWTSVG